MSKSVKKKLLFTVGALVSLFSSWSLSRNNFPMPIWTLQHALHCNAGEERAGHFSCIKVCDRRQTPEACFCVLSTVTCKTSVTTVVVLLFHIWVCRWLSVIGGSKGRIDWLTTWRWLIWWHRHGRPVIHPRLTSTGRLYVTCPALFHVGVDYLFIWLSFSHVFVSHTPWFKSL